MSSDINLSNESIVTALNNKVDLDANNTNVIVKTTGDQIIDGNKTFIQDIYHNSLTPWIYNNLTTIDKGVVPDALETSGFGVYDKNVENSDESTIGQRRIGAFSVSANPNYYRSSIIVNKPEKDLIEFADISIFWPFNEDRPYTRAPRTRDEPNDSEIVTVDYLNKKISEIYEEGSNYIRFNTGLQICWGAFSGTGFTDTQIVFSKEFINTNYSITLSRMSNDTTETNQPIWIREPLSTTGFKLYADVASTSGMYQAIGHWK